MIVMKRLMELFTELSRISSKDVRSNPKYWATHADLYEKFLLKITDREKLKVAYNKALKKIKNKERRAALTFFYRIRRDQLDNESTL
jgi:hypothetical protein